MCRHPFGRSKAGGQPQTPRGRGLPCHGHRRRGQYRGPSCSDFYQNCPPPTAPSARHPLSQALAVSLWAGFALDSVLSLSSSGPGRAIGCLHPPGSGPSDAASEPLWPRSSSRFRGSSALARGVVFLPPRLTKRKLGQRRGVTKTVISRESLCLSLKHSLVLKNGTLKRPFTGRRSQSSGCTLSLVALATDLSPASFLLTATPSRCLVACMQAEATLLSGALSGSRATHVTVPEPLPLQKPRLWRPEVTLQR